MIQQSARRYAAALIVLIIIVVFLIGLLLNQNPGSGKTGLSVSGKQNQGKQDGSLIIPQTSYDMNSDRSSTEYKEMMMNTSAEENINNPVPSVRATETGITPSPQYTPTGTFTTSPTVVSTTTIPVPTTSAGPVTPVPTAVSPSAEVGLHGQLIIPHSMTVSRGTTVVWKNRDFVPRSVNSGAGSPIEFNSGILQPGESFSYTFTEPGTYPFVSGSPKVFHGTIIVI